MKDRKGRPNHSMKLTEEAVLHIRSLGKLGMPAPAIRRSVEEKLGINVTRQSITRVLSGITH